MAAISLISATHLKDVAKYPLRMFALNQCCRLTTLISPVLTSRKSLGLLIPCLSNNGLLSRRITSIVSFQGGKMPAGFKKVFLMKLCVNHSTSVVLAVLSLLSVSGCMSTTATNISERGRPATEAEVTEHFSGNFVRLGEGGAFFAADGTFQSVGPAGEQISIGTWSPGETLCVNTTYYGTQNGQTASSGLEKDCYFIWINDDGTAMGDPLGNGPNLNMARPERGFPIQARFNALRRNLGV